MSEDINGKKQWIFAIQSKCKRNETRTTRLSAIVAFFYFVAWFARNQTHSSKRTAVRRCLVRRMLYGFPSLNDIVGYRRIANTIQSFTFLRSLCFGSCFPSRKKTGVFFDLRYDWKSCETSAIINAALNHTSKKLFSFTLNVRGNASSKSGPAIDADWDPRFVLGGADLRRYFVLFRKAPLYCCHWNNSYILIVKTIHFHLAKTTEVCLPSQRSRGASLLRYPKWI